jgi:hypothetical protein
MGLLLDPLSPVGLPGEAEARRANHAAPELRASAGLGAEGEHGVKLDSVAHRANLSTERIEEAGLRQG